MKRILILIFSGILVSQVTVVAQQKTWSLEECIRYAIDNNIQIKQQTIQTKLQENALDLAKLKLLPSLNAQASYGYNFGRALDVTSYQFYNRTLRSGNVSASGSTPVFSGLQNYNNIQKNKYLVLASKEDLQNISDNVALNVALDYLQILLNKELVTANQNQVDISRQQIQKTQKLVDAGSVARGNLLQIEAQEAQEELNLINTRNQLETSYLNLTQLLELNTPEGFEIVVPQITVDTNTVISGNINDIYQAALNNRPEIKSSELKLTASQYDLKIAKGGRSPQLSVNHSFYTRYSYIINETINKPFKDQLKDNQSSGINLAINIPILNGWQVNKNIANSKLNVESSQYALDGMKKQLYKNIQQAYTDAVASLKKYTASKKAVASAEESFRYTQQKFDLGLVAPVDYNASKTQLLNAQSDLAQAKYEFIFKTRVLDFYKGLPLNLNKIN